MNRYIYAFDYYMIPFGTSRIQSLIAILHGIGNKSLDLTIITLFSNRAYQILLRLLVGGNNLPHTLITICSPELLTLEFYYRYTLLHLVHIIIFNTIDDIQAFTIHDNDNWYIIFLFLYYACFRVELLLLSWFSF